MLVKRVSAMLALAFGMAGMVGCLAGAYAVWLVESRLDRANHRLFDAVDRSLEVVQARMPIVQQQLSEWKVTTTEVGAAVREWGTKKAQDRIVSQLQIGSRVEKLSGHLQAADLRIEASREAVRDVRRVLEVGQGLGVQVNPASTDAVQELLVSLQDTLQQAARAVDGVRKLAIPDRVEEGQAQVAKLLARILLTLSEVDRRLDHFAARLSEVRTEAQQGRARTSHYIVLGSVVCYGLLAWGMAGQTALSWWGWSYWRRRRLPGGLTANEA
jgi:hypothetical protein